MEDSSKQDLVSYIDKASVIILGLLFILFPIVFTNITTDTFVLPKQSILIFGMIALAILFGIKNFLESKVRLRRTPFDLPFVLLIISVFLSSIFAVSKFDSFQNFVPFLFAAFSYFAITNNTRNEKSLLFLLLSLLTGGALASLISIASFFNIFVFPFDFAKVKTFTTLGTSMDLSIYLFLLLPTAIYFLLPFIKRKSLKLSESNNKNLPQIFGIIVTSLIILVGFIASVYSVLKLQPPIILPLETGFQTAFAAISQDSGRFIQGLLFGSGYGEYMNVFTRFKQASFNSSPYWNLTFFRSSTFVLELLATTGLLGLLSFLFLCFKVARERPLFIPLLIVLATTFVIPFSFYHIALIFFLLGIYASFKGLTDHPKYFDVEIKLVALRRGFISFLPESTGRNKESEKILSYIVFAIILLFSVGFGFLTTKFLIANVTFQKSLVAASQNNGSLTYKYQSDAITAYRYSDVYQRIFSQTNLALASSLVSSIPQGSSVSAQTTQTVYTLVQQSINAARQATTLSPQNAIDWQNLSNIYRNLIGFGQNADSFAVVAAQQAEQLDSTNPQEYINLGGIYYQLGSWDNAQTQFQLAANLKQDFPNAYYNLGHTLLQKGDLKGALAQFQIVKQLVANDPTNLAKINAEISDLQSQIGKTEKQNQPAATGERPSAPLGVTAPSNPLPTQNPPVKIPAPQNISPSPKKTPTTTPQPSVTP